MHDRFNSTLAARVWVSKLLHTGDWPLWYPYVRYGFPLTTLHFASYFWDPLGLVLGALFSFDVWTFQIEEVLERLIGLTGAYFFARRHVRSQVSAAAVACSYVGSGVVASSVVSSVSFPSFMVAPWLFVGLDRSFAERAIGERCSATGILALAVAGLIWMGYPGTWLTAAFFAAPYALIIGLSRGVAWLRLMGIATAGGLLAAGMCAFFIAETLTFPLFGAEQRDLVPMDSGILLYESLAGLWLPNPTYAPGIGIANVEPLYLGLLSILLTCSRLSIGGRRLLRPGLLTLMGVLIVAILLQEPSPLNLSESQHLVAAGIRRVARADLLMATILGILAITAFPTRLAHWDRQDQALIAMAAAATVVALPTPVGNFLRSEVPPFSLVRWNFQYMWVAALALPLLAWRGAEQRFSSSSRKLPPPLTRLRAWTPAWMPALGLILAIHALVAVAPSGTLSRPDSPALERIGTALLAWQFVLAGSGAIALAVYLRPRLGQRAAASVLIATSTVLLSAALILGWALPPGDDLTAAVTHLPRGGRHLIDIAHHLVVLAAAAAIALRATSWSQILRGLALVAVFDVGLASTRYLSDGATLPSYRSPRSVSALSSSTFSDASTNRVAFEPTSLDFHLALTQTPTMWRWPQAVPQVAELDATFGEPSVFQQFAHFPNGWLQNEQGTDVSVTAEQLRTTGSVLHAGGGEASSAMPGCTERGLLPFEVPAAWVTRMLSSHVWLEVLSDCERLLVYTDTWAPGWQVRVDGRPAQALRVNGAIRGVMVPMGHHAVEWVYHPPHLAVLLAVTATAALISLALVMMPYFVRLRQM